MIIIIDNYDSFTYNLYQTVAQLYPDVRVFRNDKITIEEIKQFNPKGIILSPGPGRPENAGICVELIKFLNNTNLPISLLGVCLGLQAITIAFGGKVIHANEIVHGKADMIHHHSHHFYKNLPNPFKAGRYHSLIADRSKLPKTLIIDAENKNNIIMGIRHQSKKIYGVQFHPESILTPQGNQLLQDFVYGLAS